MAALMGDEEDEEGDEEKEENEEECEEEEEEEESESESESESSEEEESDEEDYKDLPLDQKKDKLQGSAKKHENCLNALKKGKIQYIPELCPCLILETGFDLFSSFTY